jgi:signal transduction histidine kinase
MSTDAKLVNPSQTLADNNLTDVLHAYVEAAARLQQTHTALQHEVVQLRAELASKDRELETRRRLAALGELAAGVAHEVRNPLGAIQLYSGLLRQQCRTQQLQPALQLLDKIEAGIQAIEAVVQDTLALAPRDRRLAVCSVRETLTAAAEAAQRTLEQRNVALEIDPTSPNLCVSADPRGLQRVLINLLVNAAEASAPGSHVYVRVASTPEEITLQVLDEGCGLPADTQHRIFEPFFTTKANGTGLGLTIAHRLIEAYGGRLHAANRPAGGAEFAITLPSAHAADLELPQNANEQRFTAA